MSVHGVGAAAAHRPQFAQNTQRGNRPAPTQTTEGDANTAVAPPNGPPAHGVRRLLAEGHFTDSGAYGPLTAKFGVPVGPTEAAPEDAAETGAAEPLVNVDELVLALELETPPQLDAPLVEPVETPMIDELLPEGPPPEDPPVTASGLLDIDSLLMEELVNEQPIIEQIVDQLADAPEPTDGTDDTDVLAA